MLGLISTYTYLNLQLQYVPDPPILRSLMTGDPPTQKNAVTILKGDSRHDK